MDKNLLKYMAFVKTVEYGSFTKASEILNYSQSGIIRIGTFSSVATHWLPNIIKEFQKDFPNIDYELLLGDYTEIEEWISTGRVDFGFLRLPTHKNLDCIFLEKDEFMAIVPKHHPYANKDIIPVEVLCDNPFMLLEKGVNSEISDIFKTHNLNTDKKHLHKASLLW